MLGGAQHNATLSQTATEQTIAIASRAVQLSAQAEAMPEIDFAIPPNNSTAPNIKDLLQTAYLGADGSYVPLGGSVALVQADNSFGDLNGDGLDDAMAIVERTDASGGTTFALAAMLNQGGIMFNIADLPLGSSLQVFSHNIIQGGDFVINMQTGDQPAATSTYYLLGDQLMKV
jgi:hypothetical protein